MISRRLFLTGLIAAPVIVRAGILMPVRPLAHEMTATEALDRMALFQQQLSFKAGHINWVDMDYWADFRGVLHDVRQPPNKPLAS